MIKIIVSTEEEKQEFLSAIYHFHGADINTDIPMVNEIVHLYHNPENVIVSNHYNGHAEYLEGLKQKVLEGNKRVEQ